MTASQSQRVSERMVPRMAAIARYTSSRFHSTIGPIVNGNLLFNFAHMRTYLLGGMNQFVWYEANWYGWVDLVSFQVFVKSTFFMKIVFIEVNVGPSLALWLSPRLWSKPMLKVPGFDFRTVQVLFVMHISLSTLEIMYPSACQLMYGYNLKKSFQSITAKESIER